MASNHAVKFKLFEENNSIKISIQREIGEKEESNEQDVLEYYVASEPQNIERILNTLVDTVKTISIEGRDLHMNYRKNDTFVIQGYNQLKRHPELRRLFKKIERKLDRLEEKTLRKGIRKDDKKISTKIRKKIGLFLAAGTVLIAGFFSVKSQLEDDYEQSFEKDENGEFDTGFLELVASGTELSLDFELDLSDKDEKTPQVMEEELEEEEVEQNEDEPSVENEKQKTSDTENKEATAESRSTDASNEEEIEAEIEAMAQQLSSQNATEEEIRTVAEMALSDGQAISEETAENINLVMNTSSTGINYITAYNLTPTQIDTIKATIQHEAGFDEVEVYAAMSTVINRSESGGWPGGKNPYGIITGSGQFQSYYEGHYQKYLNGGYSEVTSQIVDAMLTGQLEPMHDFERFASGESAKGVQYTKNGNHYR